MNKSEYFNLEAKQAFLNGDTMVIKDLGKKYLSILGKSPIPDNKLDEFLKGSPEYLQPTGEGWGMSTDDALRCLFDLKRTKPFIKGINQEVKRLRNRFPNDKLVAVEAGCGTGILTLALALSGINHVIGIEINPHTAEATNKFINSLGASNRIEIIQDDATTYDLKQDIHFIVSENMHTGLFFEPQLQILENLKKRLKPGGTILPQGINLFFASALVNWNAIEKDQIELRKAKDLIHQVGGFSCLPFIDFTSNSTPLIIAGYIPLLDKMNGLVTEMNVNIGDGIVLKSGEAEFLGQPHLVKINPTQKNGKDHALIYYQPGNQPPKELLKF